MADWGEGYVTDINYVSGFSPEMSPAWLATAAALLGFQAPDTGQPYRYAELGCGQGFGLALLAAANPTGRFYGFDFNPAQTAHAQRLAESAGLTNAEFHEASFSQLAEAADGDWPLFEFVALHGVYSWVSRDNQLAIQTFLRRFLKPGGLAYISYNCAPGWAAMVPLRRLMRLYAERRPAARSDIQGQEALGFIQRLREGGAVFFNANDIGGRLDHIAKQPSNYIPHEYLNRDWSIIDFADMAKDCASAKLDYLGSATLAENIDSASAPAGLLPLLAEADPVLRQTLLDFASNKGFRRDIYQKGLGRLTQQEHLAAVRRIRLAALNIPADKVYNFKIPMGEAQGNPALYGPLLAALRTGEMSLADLAANPAMAGMNLGSLVETALMLVGTGYAHPCQAGAAAPAFNRAVCAGVMDCRDYGFLAAPRIGGGVAVGFADVLAALVLADAPDMGPEAFVDAAWRLLEQKERRLVKDGVMLQTRQDSVAELRAIYANFRDNTSGRWRELGALPW